MKRVVRYTSILYFIALVAIWGCIHFDTGSWWPITLFLFSPRWVIAVPLLVLVPLTLATQFRLAFVYLLHGPVIVFCILGYQVSWTGQADLNERQVLRVLTCNLGGGSVNTHQLAELARSHDIHVLMLQECPWSISRPVFQQLGWIHYQVANVAIGSSFALEEKRVVARRSPTHYNAIVAISCEIRVPCKTPAVNEDGDSSTECDTVQLVNVHFPTFRPALVEVPRRGLAAGTAIDNVGARYRQTVERVVQQIKGFDAAQIIAGDFNVPVESAYFRNYWSDYQNAFSEAGTGFGYTKVTRFHGVRVDHVLVDSDWNINSAAVQQGLGGDHRPVLVELTLKR